MVAGGWVTEFVGAQSCCARFDRPGVKRGKTGDAASLRPYGGIRFPNCAANFTRLRQGEQEIAERGGEDEAVAQVKPAADPGDHAAGILEGGVALNDGLDEVGDDGDQGN